MDHLAHSSETTGWQRQKDDVRISHGNKTGTLKKGQTEGWQNTDTIFSDQHKSQCAILEFRCPVQE